MIFLRDFDGDRADPVLNRVGVRQWFDVSVRLE